MTVRALAPRPVRRGKTKGRVGLFWELNADEATTLRRLSPTDRNVPFELPLRRGWLVQRRRAQRAGAEQATPADAVVARSTGDRRHGLRVTTHERQAALAEFWLVIQDVIFDH